MCKQSLSPFHSVASLRLGHSLRYPYSPSEELPRAALPKTARLPARCPHRSGHLRASQPSPERPRDGRLWKSHSLSWQGISRSQGQCGIPFTSGPRARCCTPHCFHLQTLQVLAKREGRHCTFIPLPVLNRWVVTRPACSHRLICSQSWVDDKGRKSGMCFYETVFPHKTKQQMAGGGIKKFDVCH